nr:hypothetical protein [uncultured Dongia sp.]
MSEIARLGKALEILAQTLRVQRVTFEHTRRERDGLRSELDIANAKVRCLAVALEAARSEGTDSRSRPFTLAAKRDTLH